ncbi:MAG: DNA polymerase I [Nitrospinota bacterium]|nr:DNA polymerase I [Nitrospinota bacterium]
MTQKPLLCIIDGAGYYFRAYYAIRQQLTNSRGLPTNAVFGFSLMLKKIIADIRPDLLLMALDSKEKTFRHDMYSEYKANRPAMPEDLAAQLPYIDKLIEAYNMAAVRMPGWEADDIIGAVAHRAQNDGYDVVIVTSDKDLMQLVRPGIEIFDSMKDKKIGPDQVMEKFGVTPQMVADVLGLMGDSSDNIPGAPGVGEKTARALVAEYGDVEAVIMAAEGMTTKKKLRQSLIENAELIRLSKKLATVDLDAPVEIDYAKWRYIEPDAEKLKALFTELEFKTLLTDMPAAPRTRVPRDYRTVESPQALAELVAELEASSGFAVDTETTSQNPMKARLVGMSFSCHEGKGWYLPLRHTGEGAERQLPLDQALPPLARLLADQSKPKVGQNIKYDIIVLASEGVEVSPVTFDTMVASYLIDPAGRHGLSRLANVHLGETMIEYKDVCGSGASQITFDQVPIDKAAEYAAEDADMTWRLCPLLEPMVRSDGLWELMERVELPLIMTLATMERNGVLVDSDALARLSESLGARMDQLEQAVYEAAGEEFNLNSPKQLGAILFDKLGLATGKKKKTGYSTDQQTLEGLADQHEVPRLAMEHRQLAKLRGTYAEALPKMVNPATGRIHTSYNQAVAATGRLSSSEPNLQNIPIRTELGRMIRRAFIAPPGRMIVSADYSQIELRLLAHHSGESALLEAFGAGEDIHTRTAAEVFSVDPLFVTADMRRVAKSVNFGIIYGQTAFGLARELGITRGEAQRYIDNYFRRYPGIRDFMEKMIEQAREQGYVSTFMGRQRRLPDIKASNRQIRQFAERNAINSPLQGGAADIIKIAMNSIHHRMRKEKYESLMVLQVHDELVFEVEEAETDRLAAMVKEEMEGAAPLAVPLVVDVGIGSNWDEAH